MSNTRIFKRTALATSVVAAAVALGIALPKSASTEPTQGNGKALFGRAWVAKSVTKNGEGKPLAEGTRLVLRLRHGRKADRARWDAGCNDFSARVNVDGDRLRFSRVIQTMMGCERKLMRQESWIARFLGSDPRWQREAGKLILRRGGNAIELKRRPRRGVVGPTVAERIDAIVPVIVG
ncbi:MAG TPA: META domain-containing protein [Solirubrobacterales bacterium]